MKTRMSGVLAALAACALMLPGPARAEEDEWPAPPSVAPPLAALGATIDDDALATQRGGQQDVYVNDARLRASIANTSTSQLQTGMNMISDGAFANSNGLPIAIQNSGNNVVIQNSTILNLQLK